MDFVIYRETPKSSRVTYGYAQPFQMDMIYDPEVYTFLGLDPVLSIAAQSGIKTLLPIKSPKQSVHQFLDHRIPALGLSGGHGQNGFPVKYSIVARFSDGSETVVSKDVEVYF